MAKGKRQTESGAPEINAGRKWIIPEERDRLTKKQIKTLFLQQDGLCPQCYQPLQVKGFLPVAFIDEHLNPLWRGGSNELRNRGLLCKKCAGIKTSLEATERAKGERSFEKQVLGLKRRKGRPMPGSRDSPYKRTMDGRTIKR